MGDVRVAPRAAVFTSGVFAEIQITRVSLNCALFRSVFERGEGPVPGLWRSPDRADAEHPETRG
ncbi:hypothetical protein F7R91_07065 [Streptomyces luteolifulvus]|jgi:hypothetical protein|uniref:Uncharacterized protein n=1 Tax=Streptomyces luteolifulvus TaxID=2615112 RepID=A0A6H9V5L5_9ACTN|nr:hypothetical protein [Streptomyces luteolifulvus]KAB1148564.1 hypothetical protein F7R91_07065 [Streptomyces luteolifulvus]